MLGYQNLFRNTTMTFHSSTIRHGLKIELEEYLSKKYGGFQREVLLSKITDTKRKFRADYFVPSAGFTIEINGGQWMQGRHVRPMGYEDDLRKINILQKNGIRCFQYTYDMLKSREYLQDI